MPTFTMRMPDKDYGILQAMALLTGKSMAELVREAIIEKVHRFVDQADELERKIDEDAQQRKAALRLVKDNVS